MLSSPSPSKLPRITSTHAAATRRWLVLAGFTTLLLLAGITRVSYELGKQAVDTHARLISADHSEQPRSLMQLLLPSASDKQLNTLCLDHLHHNDTTSHHSLQAAECTTQPCPQCPKCPQPSTDLVTAKPTHTPMQKLWFQHAYIVSYRTEKWQHFLEQFTDQSWNEFRDMLVRDKLPVVDGTKLNRTQLVADGLLGKVDQDVQYGDSLRPLRLGELACTYGHFHAWQACYNETHKVKDHTNNVKHCFIGEDDGDFTAHNLTIHNMRQWGDWLLQGGLMDMYDVVYLGYGSSWYFRPLASTQHFAMPEWNESRLFWYLTQAYVISAGAAQKLRDTFLPLTMPVDVYMGKLCSEGVLRCLQILPEQVIPQALNPGGSDTQGIN